MAPTQSTIIYPDHVPRSANRNTKVVNHKVVQLFIMHNHKHHRTWDESLMYIHHINTKVIYHMVVQLFIMHNHKHHKTWDESLMYIHHRYY